ncbi:MAG: FAD-dependent oxidoreductase [Chloroflexi bacterium]|nr:FAD-dependent oxidoreductase [Chloroflexota bacterium]
MADIDYLIIGNGVAGITAAQEIRYADAVGRILIVSDEGEPYYYRASLSEWISGQTTDEMLPGRTAAFYDEMDIEQMTGHVTQIDIDTKQSHLANGDTLKYDKLLIATGACANIHPVEGLAETDTLVFRDLANSREIKERLGCCGRALIVGGGILGLELAGALHRIKKQPNSPPLNIAIVQRSHPLGKPLLDSPAAGWLQQRMQADDIDVFVGDTVTRVEGQTAHFQSGRTWDFDVFVQAIGITPVFPDVPGITARKGIHIDERCQTNLPDVYAAGDCTETCIPGSDIWETTRIWLNCAQQGRTAGRNMAGQDDVLPSQPFFNASIIYTTLYTYIGEPHSDEGQVYVWWGNSGYRKVRVVDGKLAGALLLDERHGSMALFKAIGQPVAQFGADIARPDFPFNDLTGQDWDYLFY